MIFEVSTLNSIKEFNEFFREIKKKYPNLTMPMAREYLKNGTRIADVSDELYDDLDRLSRIRNDAIETEKVHILAQAEKAGINLPEEFFSSKNLTPFFKDDIYEKIPTLKVFEYMIFYTGEELSKMNEKEKITAEIAGERD